MVCNLQFTAHKKVIKTFHNWATFFLKYSLYISERKIPFSVSKYIPHFCHVTEKQITPKKKKKCFVKSNIRYCQIGPSEFHLCSQHSRSASQDGWPHPSLYITPRDGHSRVTFLRSCGRLQAIALRRPHAVNHVIFGCYSRTYHSALQFRPVWWALFLMLFGFMCSICQKIPFR